MAKIIVTAISCWKDEILSRTESLVDTNCKFSAVGEHTSIFTPDGSDHILAEESIIEIQKRINEAEAQATNKKLDEILANQKDILRQIEGIDRHLRICL